MCLLNSFANPVHELMIKDIVTRRAPDLPCCISFEVLPEIKEYERTSTTVINTYVMPIVARYLATLREELERLGIAAALLLMQSNGGLTTAEAAMKTPMHIIESGPAAGVIGAQALARVLTLPNVITFDMGGTTAKASIVEGGEVARSLEYQVGGGIMDGISVTHRRRIHAQGAAIDLAEVGQEAARSSGSMPVARYRLGRTVLAPLLGHSVMIWAAQSRRSPMPTSFSATSILRISLGARCR